MYNFSHIKLYPCFLYCKEKQKWYNICVKMGFLRTAWERVAIRGLAGLVLRPPEAEADIIFDPADNFDSRCTGALSTGPIYGLRQEKTGSEQP